MKVKRFLCVVCVLAGLAFAAPRGWAQGVKAAAAPQLAILDTDIGDDIDDAFALALALQSPELKIVGITTEFGDTDLRARLVDRYLAAVGRRDIPVLAGVKTEAKNVFTQKAYAEHAVHTVHGDAVEFLLSQIRKYPGKITLIAIGPLGNVKAAIARDPATFRQLKRVVLMGGSVYRGYGDRPAEPEWNFLCDPAAAKALFAAGVPVVMAPLDSTQIHMPAEELRELLAHGSPLTDQLALLYEQWAAKNEGHSPTPTLFDPVAVTYAVRPELCPAKPLRIEIEANGLSKPVEGEPNAAACLKADEAGILAFLKERITGESVR